MDERERQRQAFGQRVKVLRKARGMKQDTLAEALGYRSRVSISHLETGREDLPLAKVFALAEAFEVSPAELFAPGRTAADALGRDAGLSSDMQHLMRVWELLTAVDRQTLLRCAELLATGEADIRRHLKGQLALMAETVEARVLKRNPHGTATADGQADSALAG